LLSIILLFLSLSLFFFIDPAPSGIYTLSLHDALPIFSAAGQSSPRALPPRRAHGPGGGAPPAGPHRRRGTGRTPPPPVTGSLHSPRQGVTRVDSFPPAMQHDHNPFPRTGDSQ